jgi:hypothetical protein
MMDMCAQREGFRQAPSATLGHSMLLLPFRQRIQSPNRRSRVALPVCQAQASGSENALPLFHFRTETPLIRR